MSYPVLDRKKITSELEDAEMSDIDVHDDVLEEIFPRPADDGRYRPHPVSEDAKKEIRQEMRAAGRVITPDAELHATEAYELRDFLRRCRVVPHRKVVATGDGRGVVKLTFEEFRKVINMVELEEWVDAGWGEDPEDL